MLKLLGRLIGLNGTDLKYNGEDLLFMILISFAFIFLGIFKSITSTDVLKLQSFLQNISTLKFNFSYFQSIAEVQHNNIFSIVYFCIGFIMLITFFILKYLCKIDMLKYKTFYKSTPTNTYSCKHKKLKSTN